MACLRYRLTSCVRIGLDYDMRIAEPLRLPGGEEGVDLWPTLEALKNVPALILRGALSDLFSAQTAQQLLARLAKAELVVVSAVGHSAVLEAPEAEAGDARFLERCLGEAVTAWR